MKNYNRIGVSLAVIGISLAAASGAYAQFTSINSVVLVPRVFNDYPGATASFSIPYPTSITLGESGEYGSSGFANRDEWLFSNNGSSAYLLAAGDTSFTASFTLDVTGTTTGDNEAGWIIPNGPVGPYTTAGNGTLPGGDMQFIADPNSGFLGFFGGPGFWNSGITYVAGTTVTMMIQYYQTGGTGNMIFSVMDGSQIATSPVESWNGNLAGDVMGGYFQLQGSTTAPGSSGQAVFGNVVISVPEPTTFALLGIGMLPLARLLRRRA